jgi:hypothetical protein
MFTRKLGLLALGLWAVGAAFAEPGPDLGVEISADDLAPWDISVEPDGSGLPPGQGTVAEGEAVYMAQCMVCHGAEGAGQPHDRLVGGQGTLTELQQVRTIGSYWPYASTVFDYIRRAMPFNTPESLTNDEVYALTAYLLYENGVIEQDTVLDAASLSQVVMPNRDGFVMAYP